MHWGKIGELLAAATGLFSEMKNLCVWNKTNAGMGSLYRSKHELIFVFKRGNAPHINNVELGRFGRGRTNVWDYPGQNTLNGTSKSKLSLHPGVSTQEAVLLRLREKALKGDARALDRLLVLAQTFNNDVAIEALSDKTMAAEDQAILDAYAEEVRSRPASPDPDPLGAAGESGAAVNG